MSVRVDTEVCPEMASWKQQDRRRNTELSRQRYRSQRSWKHAEVPERAPGAGLGCEDRLMLRTLRTLHGPEVGAGRERENPGAPWPRSSAPARRPRAHHGM
ncbi:unnamed protein product [Rangifer tarandus platyrhynchus]|uniref:Uncharacterized protein n=1 Tax=Rangifer tarandus platyrhynchus TaxID=3082113 RepID=A0AC59ZME6_RANTA